MEDVINKSPDEKFYLEEPDAEIESYTILMLVLRISLMYSLVSNCI